jgi:hypothetical protein
MGNYADRIAERIIRILAKVYETAWLQSKISNRRLAGRKTGRHWRNFGLGLNKILL